MVQSEYERQYHLRVRAWVAAIANIGIPAAIITLDATDAWGSAFDLLAVLAFAVLMTLWLVLSVFAIRWLCESFRAREWKAVALAISVPVCAMAGLGNGNACYVGDAIRFAIHRPMFDAAVGQSKERHPRLLVFNWSSAWDWEEVLLYDESTVRGKLAPKRLFATFARSGLTTIWGYAVFVTTRIKK